MIYGHTFGAIFFGERPTVLSLVGTALIVLGVAIVAIRPGKKLRVEPRVCLHCDDLLPADPPPDVEPLLPVSGSDTSNRPQAAVMLKSDADDAQQCAGDRKADYEPPVLVSTQSSDVVVHIGSQRSSSEAPPTAA